jgi:hypothetical protein
MEVAAWGSFVELRCTFGTADTVRVASGRNVVIFNIGGNNFRLICAVPDYSKENWKDEWLINLKIKNGLRVVMRIERRTGGLT